MQHDSSWLSGKIIQKTYLCKSIPHMHLWNIAAPGIQALSRYIQKGAADNQQAIKPVHSPPVCNPCLLCKVPHLSKDLRAVDDSWDSSLQTGQQHKNIVYNALFCVLD